ncbi:nucleolar DEAD-box protein required for synthesis of 60S ribosomal subunit [Entomophthora muscae]|uniref:Nucleolar DEAD-box protein required for synthesis of 60S ribosomal subunit n=1 Tax=Entomophthora muscae TaxID=34485 RepID=A0ACC2TS95_9FUNG|nr:nucleolar DEAD-box protein required for synthesis of 60S ribosomal subunit [Entomophthora muscae]
MGKNSNTKKGDDDFIRTIHDGQIVPDLEQEINEVKSKGGKNLKDKQSKKPNNKKTKAEKTSENADFDIDPGFTFDTDENTIVASNFHVLGFGAARDGLRVRSTENKRTSINEKISLQLAKDKVKRINKNKDAEGNDATEEQEATSDQEQNLFAESDQDIVSDSDESEDGLEEDIMEKRRQDDSDEEHEETAEEKARKDAYFAPESESGSVLGQADTFATMNLSRPILKGLSGLGFVRPTPIQARAIPVALMGKDVCGGAVTGSGKTAAFIVPILERLLYKPRAVALTRVLVLCPTRELAIQCHNVATKIGTYADITFCLCVGGLSIKSQEANLKMQPDFVIATPGRLIDHLRNSASFNLDSIEILVMDEADRMLEDGFADELNEIVSACPKERQTMLFSATMTENVDELIRLSLRRPVRLMVDSSKTAAKRLIQEFVRVRAHRESDRAALLVSLCRSKFKSKCIVFFRSKAAAHQMKIVYGLLGLKASELHGNLSQEQRIQALEDFRDGTVDFLLATDLAARGLDIQGVDTVINYNMPSNFSQYLHRVGRTARAGRAGRSVSLVGEGDRKVLKAAIKSINSVDLTVTVSSVKHRTVPQEVVEKLNLKLANIAPKITAILQEEKEEKMINKGLMEANKASNFINHEDEIKSRPARSWFQSSQEKKKAKALDGKAFKRAKH